MQNKVLVVKIKSPNRLVWSNNNLDIFGTPLQKAFGIELSSMGRSLLIPCQSGS